MIKLMDEARSTTGGIVPFRVSPMLATLVDAPFSEPIWIYEEKYDGVRILAYKKRSEAALMSRNASEVRNLATQFSPLAETCGRRGTSSASMA